MMTGSDPWMYLFSQLKSLENRLQKPLNRQFQVGFGESSGGEN